MRGAIYSTRANTEWKDISKKDSFTEGKRPYASIEKKDKTKITVILSFGTSRFYQQVFKKIQTDWNMGKYTKIDKEKLCRYIP